MGERRDKELESNSCTLDQAVENLEGIGSKTAEQVKGLGGEKWGLVLDRILEAVNKFNN